MKYHITIGWLYPELMSTYGDRGNVMILAKRGEWRSIGVTVRNIDFTTKTKEIEKYDLIFGGGAQDRQQGIVIEDLLRKKGPVLSRMIASGTPGLFVCGSPQLLGHFYMTGAGEKLQGLGIFDMETRHPGKNTPRCIGNLIGEVHEDFFKEYSAVKFSMNQPNTVVGFENHGGRTYLGKGVKPFARVLYGHGNNGEDSTEGAVYKNCIATYSHGPFLSKNPHIADWLIAKTLEVKYGKTIPLNPVDDALMWKAHTYMLTRLLHR